MRRLQTVAHPRPLTNLPRRLPAKLAKLGWFLFQIYPAPSSTQIPLKASTVYRLALHTSPKPETVLARVWLLKPRREQLCDGYSSAVESSGKIHGSPIKRCVCFSNKDRVSPFVSASLQWRPVSIHMILTLSRCPTSERISWYSASQCLDLSDSQCSSLSLIAICESHSIIVLSICS